MPFDIEMNTNLPNVKIMPSKSVELVTAVSLLSDIKHHQFAKEWSDQIIRKLTKKSSDMLKLLSNMPLQGLEILEFILEDRIFEDTEAFIHRLLHYDELQFIYKMSSEELSIDEIKNLKEDKNLFDMVKQEKMWFVNNSFEVMEYMIYETTDFKKNLVQLYREVETDDFNERYFSLKSDYLSQINDLNHHLLKSNPLDTAQKLLGKKFARVFDFKEYFFIPSYFISPHNIRIFNQKAQMVVFDMRSDKEEKREEGERLSSSLRIISDKTRLEILRLLLSKSNYGKTIASRIGLTTATISHHLEQLKSINLVTEERIKNYKYFKANEEEIDKLLEGIKNYLYNN